MLQTSVAITRKRWSSANQRDCLKEPILRQLLVEPPQSRLA